MRASTRAGACSTSLPSRPSGFLLDHRALRAAGYERPDGLPSPLRDDYVAAAERLEKLAKTQDGDGTLLDHSMLLYGSGLSDGNIHYPVNLPIMLAGTGAGTLKGGTHFKYESVPLANLHLSLMDKFGVEVEKFGNSTGRLEGLAHI